MLCIILWVTAMAMLGMAEVKQTKDTMLHVIKLKSSFNHSNPTLFIQRHHHLYHATQIKHGGVAANGVVPELPPEAVTMTTVRVGNTFSAVVGSFSASFADYLNSLDVIEAVEPNHIYRATAPSLGRRLVQQQTRTPSWGLARISHRQNDLETSLYDDHNAGQDVHVYVFDTGVHLAHPEFEGRASLEVNLIDDGSDDDLAGHGTHVAGTIGGKTFGVAKQVRLHSVKILNKYGDGTSDALLKGIEHVTRNAKGNSIINLSLTGPRSKIIEDALTSAVLEHNIPVFVSAGNSGDNACKYSPAANENVFAVGATNPNDEIAPFSSYGPCVRLYAPGTNIISSWLNDRSHAMDGTSMASPHVTGIAAILMSNQTFPTVHDLYDTITTIATHDILHIPNQALSGTHNLLAYNGIEP